MVITTQTGKSFLAGAGTGCAITTAPDVAPKTGDRVKDYYNRTGSMLYELTWQGHRLGVYDTIDRARKVAADFKNAADDGAQVFNFPTK